MRFVRRGVLVFVVFTALLQAAPVSLEQITEAVRKAAAHPRLLMPAASETQIRSRIDSDPTAKALFECIVAQADSLIDQPAIERIQIGKRLLDKSRTCLERVVCLSFTYRMTGDEKYLRRAEKEMLAAAGFSDWNPSHYLDVAEMTAALAIGYDWLYDKLPPESRSAIRKAIIEKGLAPSLESNDGLLNFKAIESTVTRRANTWWLRSGNNWNQVCNGGMTLGALAILEDEPKLAATLIHRAVTTIPQAMNEYLPDGAYPEGPGYWTYGTTYNIALLESLNTALKTTFGLAEHPGFSKTGEYFLHASGPTGLFFNYSDCGSGRGNTLRPEVFYLARLYHHPEWAWNESSALDRYRQIKDGKAEASLGRGWLVPLTLLWAESLNTLPTPKTLCWKGDGPTPVVMMRSGWNDQAAYVAIKGGSPKTNHAHMDIGSFVFDIGGVRWAKDLGAQDYNRLEQMGVNLFSMSQSSQRWKVMRYTNLWHNTLTLNDQLQQVEGNAALVHVAPDQAVPQAIFDLSDVYAKQANSVFRSVELTSSGLLIHDRVTTSDKPCTLRWSMVTDAKVEITPDGATLKKSGKTLLLSAQKIEDTNIPIALKTWSALPQSTLDEPNPDTRIVGFEINAKAKQQIDFCTSLHLWTDRSPGGLEKLKMPTPQPWPQFTNVPK